MGYFRQFFVFNERNSFNQPTTRLCTVVERISWMIKICRRHYSSTEISLRIFCTQWVHPCSLKRTQTNTHYDPIETSQLPSQVLLSVTDNCDINRERYKSKVQL